MLTPTSSPVPLPEGAVSRAPEGGSSGIQGQFDESDGFPVVMEDVHPGVVPEVPILPSNQAPTAQKMPESAIDSTRAAMPNGPWPILDQGYVVDEQVTPHGRMPEPTQSNAGRMQAAEHVGATADAEQLVPVEQEVASQEPGLPAVTARDSSGALPVSSELQRVELAVELARHASIDARALLASTPLNGATVEQGQIQ